MITEITRSASVLERALHDAPVEVIPRSRSDSKRVNVVVQGPRSKERLTLLWAGEGWPADLEEAIAGVPDPWPPEIVIVARRFSPGALRRLRERQANWVDETGLARIVGPSGLFVIHQGSDTNEGKPERNSVPRFQWSPSAVAIAEMILSQPSEPIVSAEIADITGFSAPQISRVLSGFDRQGWTTKVGRVRGPGSQRRLDDADGLLRRWADYVASEPRRAIQAHATLRDAMTFVRDDLGPALDDLGSWALSGWAALELEAPFATQVPTVHAYVDDASFDGGRLERLLEKTRLREVDEGGRVIFWPGDKTVFRLKHASGRLPLPVVSAPRLFADLLALGGRAEDAAEHVRETLIGF